MAWATHEICFLCSKQLSYAQGKRMVRVSFDSSEQHFAERVFHLPCFDAFTTGSLRDGTIWTYCIVGTPAEPWCGPSPGSS